MFVIAQPNERTQGLDKFEQPVMPGGPCSHLFGPLVLFFNAFNQNTGIVGPNPAWDFGAHFRM